MFSSVLRNRSLMRVHTNLAVPVVPRSFAQLQDSLAGLSITDEARRYRSNRSRRGLYNGKDVRFGNNRSFSMKSSRRKFKPNVFLKAVFSETLNKMIKFHLTPSTLRSIDKAGGLDNYLLTSKYVYEGEGQEVKERILAFRKTKEYKDREAKIAQETKERLKKIEENQARAAVA